MTELMRDMVVLVSIARLDAELTAYRTELAILPDQIAKVDRQIADIERHETEAVERLDAMNKEKRALEQEVEDHRAQINKFKVQLMQVKTNKEYTAMQHEIAHVENEIDQKEERLLVLMDELEAQQDHNDRTLGELATRKMEFQKEKVTHEARQQVLQEESAKLEGRKPGVLKELNPGLKRRYDRILAKFSDFAVTNVVDETCQGCFTRIPPQTAVEVRKNETLITCEGCGRILVHYDADA